MSNVVGRIPVGADTRPLERDIQASLNKNYQLKGLNEKAFTQPLGRITGSVDEFRKSLDASNARVLAFGASAGAIFAVQRGFQALITTTIQVQKNLTDINSIFGLTSKNLQAFGDQLFRVAAQTGQSFDTVSQAAVEFSRQGLGVEETLKRTRDALILTRLSGLDVVKSTEALTATINSFNKVALDSTTIVNKLATVDAAFAVSSADLAEAIQRVGSSAESVGLNLDQLVAIVTSVQQTTARGGSVIGNSLKTIFTRLERTEVLDQLEQLGIQVRNLDGSFRPAIDTLSELAQRFDGLSDSQRANIAELVGGVFQINILKAALGDLGKQYSIYNSALNTSTNATDAAVKRNEQLNETLSALVNRTTANLTKLGADIGNLTLAPAIESILSNINSALESFNLADAQGPGEKIAKGFLEGLGNYISGPGLALIGAVVGKLFINLAKFSTQAIGQILDLNKGAQQQAEIQQRISNILAQNPNLIQNILNKEVSLLQVEQDILNVIRAQTVAREQSARISATLAGNLTARGVTTTGGKISAKSGGFIPNFTSQEMIEVYGAYLGGYKPGKVSRMNIPGEGQIVYNQAEQVKKFPGMMQPAIIPPEGSSAGERYRKAFENKLGFNPYAADGFMPNFATASNAIIRQNENNLIRIGTSQKFKIGETGLTASQSEINKALAAKSKTTSVLDARGIATMLVPREGFSGSSEGSYTFKEGPNAGVTVVWPVKTYSKKYRNEAAIKNIEQEVRKAVGVATANYAESIKPPAEKPDPQRVSQAIDTTPGAKGSISAAAGGAFEVGLNLALSTRAASAEGLEFDVLASNPELRKLFAYSTPLADFKINDSSPGNRGSMAAKIIKASGVLGKGVFQTTAGLDKEGIAKEKAARQAAVSSYLSKNLKSKSKGFIPNYSALIDSMRREVSAGVSPNSIRVGQDPRLRNSENPLGLGVYNTKDEPKGLAEGIARYGNDILSARKAGASVGFIPNYKLTDKEELEMLKERLGLKNKEGKVSRSGIGGGGLIAASLLLPTLGGVAEQFIPQENTRARALTGGVTNALSFAATGASFGAAGGPLGMLAGAGIGGLVGLVTTLNDLDKAANQQGIQKFAKIVEQSQENLNKMNDAFVQFNTITDKLSNSSNLSAKDVEQLQTKLTTSLSGLPEELRGQLIEAYGQGDVLKIQSIQTNALEVAQAKQAIAQYQAGVAEATAPATLGEWLSESFGFSGATQRREKVLKEKLNLSTTNIAVTQFEEKTKTIGQLITEEFNSFFAAEKKAGETFQEYSKRYTALVDEAIKNPKILQFVSEKVGKKIIDEAIKTGDPDKIAAAQQQATDLLKKYAELGPEAIKNTRDALKTLGKREARTGDVEQFKNQLSRFLNEITASVVSTNLAYTRAETQIDINLKKLQSSKNNLLENARLFAGEFTQIDIEAQFAEASANLEYQKNILEINRKTRERVGPALFADTLSGLRGTNDPASKQFSEYLNTQLKDIQNIDLAELPEKITEIINEVDTQFARNTELNDKTRQAATSFIERLNDVSIKFLPEAQADLERLSQLRQAEAGIRKKEIEARQRDLRDRQTISFAGGLESLRRNDFSQRVSEFTKNRFLLGSRIPTESGQGALGLFEELRRFGIGPQSIDKNKDLENKIVSGQTSNILRFSQAYGLNLAPQEARSIAQKQFDNIAKQEQSVEEILKQLTTITSQGLNLSSTTLQAINPSYKVPTSNGGMTGTNIPGGATPILSPEGQAILNTNNALLPNKQLDEEQARLNALINRNLNQSVDTGNVRPQEATAKQVLEEQIKLLQQQYEGRQGINDLISQAAGFNKTIVDTMLNYNDSVDRATDYNRELATIVEQVAGNHISIFEAQKRIEQIQNDIATGIERENKLITDQIERRRDLKDLADGYLTSVEFANKELERQQNLARMPGYNGLQGIAVNFTNQMAYNGTQFFQDLNQSAVDVARNIQDSFSNAFQSFMNGTATAGDAFNNFAIQILQQIQQISTQIATKLFFGAIFNPLQGALMGGLGGGGFGFAKGGLVKGYANGGYVTGGSGIKDDIPAFLSKGEYVLNKRAVQSIQQAYGLDFLQSLNNMSASPMQMGGFAETFTNEFKVTGAQNTQGLDTNNIVQGMAALDRYINQLKGEKNVDPRLSNFALTDMNQVKNQERMETEEDYKDYVGYLMDVLNQNNVTYAQARGAYSKQLEAYNRQQKQSFIGSLLTGGMAILGGALLGPLSGAFGGLFGAGAAGGAGGFGAALGGSTGFGASFGIGAAGKAVTSASMGTAAMGGLGGLFSGSNLAMMGLLGAGMIGAPLLSSMLQGNQTKRNTVSPTRSGGLNMSNRWRFSKGGMSPDDVPALLMDGEYVVNKDAVKKYGSNFFEKLNRGQIKGYADGGLIGSSIPNNYQNQNNINTLDLNLLSTTLNDLKTALEDLNQGSTNVDASGGGDTNNITIQINMEDSKVTNENSQDNSSKRREEEDNRPTEEKRKNLKEFTDIVKQNVIATIIEQKRPGGLLSKSEMMSK